MSPCEDDSREHERIDDLARPPKGVRTGESSQSNDIMHCAFGVNLLHTSNIRRSCDHVYSGPVGRSQFLFIIKGVSNESTYLLIEFTDRASDSHVVVCCNESLR